MKIKDTWEGYDFSDHVSLEPIETIDENDVKRIVKEVKCPSGETSNSNVSLIPGDNIGITSAESANNTTVYTIYSTASGSDLPIYKGIDASGHTVSGAVVIGSDSNKSLGLYSLSEGGISEEPNEEGGITLMEMNTSAIGISSHAEGLGTITVGMASHAEGEYTTSIGDFSHAEGMNTSAIGMYSHAEGEYTTSLGDFSHAEGMNTSAIGISSHAEGSNTIASGYYSHAEGMYNSAIGMSSHAEGTNTSAIGDYSHAEGTNTSAIGMYSHAEGMYTSAIGNYSHAEGKRTTSLGEGSYAEGLYTSAIGSFSHAEGYTTSAIGRYSHAEGNNTIASGYSSHAGGEFVSAIGETSFANGKNVTSNNSYETSFGVSNISLKSDVTSSSTLFSVGCGTVNDSLPTYLNALEIKRNGDTYLNVNVHPKDVVTVSRHTIELNKVIQALIDVGTLVL